MPIKTLFILLLTVTLAACSTTATHPSLRGATATEFATTPIVPVHNYVADLGGNGFYQISPDGQQLMWLARVGLGQGVFVKNLRTGAVQSLATRAIPQWANDSQHILLRMDKAGDENIHIFQLDSQDLSATPKDLTPYPGSTSAIQTRIPHSADLLIINNQRDKKVFDLYHYSYATGELKLLAQNPGDVAQWVSNAQGQLLGRVRKLGDELVYEKLLPSAPSDEAQHWQATIRTSYFDSVHLLDMSADDRYIWALSNRGRDKQALVKIDLDSGAEEVVYADPRVDISQTFISKNSHQPLLAMLEPDYPERHAFTPPVKAALEAMQQRIAGHWQFQLFSASDDETLISGAIKTETGGQNILFNTQTLELTVLGELTSSHLNAISPLPQQQALQFKSRDGLTLHGYLTLPHGVSAQKLPTVLLVHGGPWARDTWRDNDYLPNFLANRGYAVLQVNYRGSSGYGRAFQDAARNEFAARMHDDLLDGVDELIRLGITDSSKVAIMGASYGGYASLVGMTFTPERFACGISYVGMSDLASLLENVPPYWELGKPWWIKFVGNPDDPKDRAVMDSKSPLYRADQVTKPLLILHGANDPRVKLDQSTRMVTALQKAGKDVDFVVFPDSGHGSDKWSDRLTYFRKTEDFLARCLGGRSGGMDAFEWVSWAF